jgi:flagellar hook protein FlgE
MFASFSTALSALDANATAVGIVGNNLANLDTPGYKNSVAYFQNLMSESLGTGTQVGFGVQQPLTMTQFTQGAIQSSGGPLDAAIQGDGFFVVNNGSTPQYTRAGSFQTDSLRGVRAGMDGHEWCTQYRRADRQHRGAGGLHAAAGGFHQFHVECEFEFVVQCGRDLRLV